MKELKVELWTKSNNYLSEINQITGMQFAFISPGLVQCHPWVKCRDFLHDALRSHISGKEEGIYGFAYNPGKNPPLNLDKMHIMVKSANMKDLLKSIKSALHIIQSIERANKIKPQSTLYKVNDSDIYAFEGASDWMESTFMISLYTFLIRLGAKNIEFKTRKDLSAKLEELSKKDASRDHDYGYMKAVLPYLYVIVQNRKSITYKREDGSYLFEKSPISTFHNYTGIISLCDKARSVKGLPELEALRKVVGVK